MGDTSDPFLIFVEIVLGVASLVLALAFEAAILYAIYFLVTIPMRRHERTRLFLDLVELGVKDGQTPEHAIMGAASSNDQALGARFHMLAAHLEKGERLGPALDQVPRLLPPEAVAMVKVGERIGSVGKILPACRRLVGDGVSQVRGALNYVLILSLVVSPAAIVIPLIMNIFIIPKFKEIFADMGGGLPAFTRLILGGGNWILLAQITVVAATWFLLFAYVGGPRVYRWSRAVLGGLPDWIHFHLPWRRKRLLRDFSAMLAILLDAHVPETEAVALAGESTANLVVQRRARKIQARLANGVKLPQALTALDDAGELRWRLANALQRGGGFLATLRGWHEALDSKAFQEEQAAAQLTTTGFLLFNGFIIAGIVIGLFLPLIALLNQATLW